MKLYFKIICYQSFNYGFWIFITVKKTCFVYFFWPSKRRIKWIPNPKLLFQLLTLWSNKSDKPFSRVNQKRNFPALNAKHFRVFPNETEESPEVCSLVKFHNPPNVIEEKHTSKHIYIACAIALVLSINRDNDGSK